MKKRNYRSTENNPPRIHINTASHVVTRAQSTPGGHAKLQLKALRVSGQVFTRGLVLVCCVSPFALPLTNRPSLLARCPRLAGRCSGLMASIVPANFPPSRPINFPHDSLIMLTSEWCRCLLFSAIPSASVHLCVEKLLTHIFKVNVYMSLLFLYTFFSLSFSSLLFLYACIQNLYSLSPKRDLRAPLFSVYSAQWNCGVCKRRWKVTTPVLHHPPSPLPPPLLVSIFVASYLHPHWKYINIRKLYHLAQSCAGKTWN